MTVRMSSLQFMYNYKTQLNRSYREQAKLYEQADGSSIHRASDSPVDYTRLMRYYTNENENEQYQRNVNNAMSWMKTTDDVMIHVGEIVKTFNEKTVAAANDDKVEADWAAIGREMLAEIQEVVSVCNTQEAGRYVFSGQKGLTEPFTMSVNEVDRALAKNLDKAQAYFFKGMSLEGNSQLVQMLTLEYTDEENHTEQYYLDVDTGYIFSKDFVDGGYKDILTSDKMTLDDFDVEELAVGKVGMTLKTAKSIINDADEEDLKVIAEGNEKSFGLIYNSETKKYEYDDVLKAKYDELKEALNLVRDSGTYLEDKLTEAADAIKDVFTANVANVSATDALGGSDVEWTVGTTTNTATADDWDNNTNDAYDSFLTDVKDWVDDVVKRPTNKWSGVAANAVTFFANANYTGISDLSANNTDEINAFLRAELVINAATVADNGMTLANAKNIVGNATDAELKSIIDGTATGRDADVLREALQIIAADEKTVESYENQLKDDTFNLFANIQEIFPGPTQNVYWQDSGGSFRTAKIDNMVRPAVNDWMNDRTGGISELISEVKYVLDAYAEDPNTAYKDADDAISGILGSVRANEAYTLAFRDFVEINNPQDIDSFVRDELLLKAIGSSQNPQGTRLGNEVRTPRISDIFTNQGLLREDIATNEVYTSTLSYLPNDDNSGYKIDGLKVYLFDKENEETDISRTLDFTTISQLLVTYHGDENYISMVKQNGDHDRASDSANLTGQDIFGSDIFDNEESGNRQSGTAMINNMITVQSKVKATDSHWLSSDGVTVSQVAFTTGVIAETTLGSRLQLYESVSTMLTNQSDTITENITNVSGTDIPNLATKLMEMTTLYNMMLSIGGRILPQSLADYL